MLQHNQNRLYQTSALIALTNSKSVLKCFTSKNYFINHPVLLV